MDIFCLYCDSNFLGFNSDFWRGPCGHLFCPLHRPRRDTFCRCGRKGLRKEYEHVKINDVYNLTDHLEIFKNKKWKPFCEKLGLDPNGQGLYAQIVSENG